MNLDDIKMDEKVHKILIVDDEKEVLEALKATLEDVEKIKCEISTALDGTIALNTLEKQDFDLVLSDFKMPKMDGIKLLKTVRDKYPNLIRILITGYSDMFLALSAINKAEVDHYLEKPWQIDELNFIIYESLKKKLDRENKLRKHFRNEYGNNFRNVKNHLVK